MEMVSAFSLPPFVTFGAGITKQQMTEILCAWDIFFFSEIRVGEGEDQWLWVRDGVEKSDGGLKSFGSPAGVERVRAGQRTQRGALPLPLARPSCRSSGEAGAVAGERCYEMEECGEARCGIFGRFSAEAPVSMSLLTFLTQVCWQPQVFWLGNQTSRLLHI